MNECFITKLRGVVDNDTLPLLGIMELAISANTTIVGDGRNRLAYFSYPQTVYVKEGTAKISKNGGNPTDSITIESINDYFTSIIPANGEPNYTICIPTDHINGIMLNVSNCKIDISNLANKDLRYELQLPGGADAHGNLNDLKFFYTKEGIEYKVNRIVLHDGSASADYRCDIGRIHFKGSEFIVRYQGKNFAGNIETFNAPNLTTLTLWGVNIAGDLQVWAQTMWNNGRRNGSCAFVYGTYPTNRLLWGSTPITDGNHTITFNDSGVSFV